MSLFNRLFATKSIERLHKEMAEDEGRLRRVLGPVGLTSLGIGAIIGAGIFVMTGRVAANDSGPAIVLSYVFAGFGCALAAFCYAEFASMVPVAGSAYTYAYATLGELLAWIIGWDLILEYAMSAATVGAAWTKYFNVLMKILFDWTVPDKWSYDPFSHPGAYMNLPAVVILALVTTILVIGIRESAASNTVLVLIKLSVVLFIISIGAGYVATANWTGVPKEERKKPEQIAVAEAAEDLGKQEDALLEAARTWAKTRFDKAAKTVTVTNTGDQSGSLDVPDKSDLEQRVVRLKELALVAYLRTRAKDIDDEMVSAGQLTPEQAKDRLARKEAEYQNHLNKVAAKSKVDMTVTPEDQARIDRVIVLAKEEAPKKEVAKWGILGSLGLNKMLGKIDDSTRSNYTPYGLSGIMLGAALVFFAFIGFDSISTHAEEAKKPQRDVPIGIITSLLVCTVLYIAVSAVITGMVPYPNIDTDAAVASAFSEKAEVENSSLLKASAGLIAAGGLAGMTSVLLITFLSQARIFLAMARDGFMPKGIFGAVHAKFKTPHISTIITGIIICIVAALTPILVLEEMVNIGTLFAFVVVSAAVLILRIKRPDARRPFRCPAVFIVAPLGILVNFTMMLFLPLDTWKRLVIWLVIGLVIYFSYGYWNSALRKREEVSTA
jgi:amino acid transporter